MKNNLVLELSPLSLILGWSVGSKPVGRNDVFTVRPKYYHKAKNREAEMTIRLKIYIVIALLLAN